VVPYARNQHGDAGYFSWVSVKRRHFPCQVKRVQSENATSILTLPNALHTIAILQLIKMSEYSDPEVYDESEEGGEEEDGKEEFEDSELRPADESHVVAYGASGKESEEEDLSHLVDELKASWDGDSDNDYGDVLEPVRGLNLIKWQIFDNLDALDSMPEAEVTPEIEGSQRHLESVLRVLSQEFPTEYLTYQLSHHYEESPLTLDGLRGKDRRRTQHLLQACDKVGLYLYLTRIRRTIHSTFSRTKGSSAGSVPPELTKIFRDEIEISGAYEMGGLQVAESMDFKKGWLIQRTLIDRSPVFARTRSQLRMATTTHERTVGYASLLRRLPLAYSVFSGFDNRTGIQPLTVHGRGRTGRLLEDRTFIV
jgi:hypothetical protein